jgi:hypothetical protein
MPQFSDAMITRYATVRFSREGFHCWPEATGRREYLTARHRHLFHVEAHLQLFNNDREVEFHDLLEFCRGRFGGGLGVTEFGARSCESLAEGLAREIALQWRDRSAIVKVFEDGEVGATIVVSPTGDDD